jgi:transcriptional regulator with XRE-family HTH domain
MPMFFGQNIKFLRLQRKLQQAEIPDLIGISRATWSDYENSRTEPKIEVIINISEFFGISIDDLLKKNLLFEFEKGKVTNELLTSKKEIEGKVNGKVKGKVNAKIYTANGLTKGVSNAIYTPLEDVYKPNIAAETIEHAKEPTIAEIVAIIKDLQQKMNILLATKGYV